MLRRLDILAPSRMVSKKAPCHALALLRTTVAAKGSPVTFLDWIEWRIGAEVEAVPELKGSSRPSV